MALKRKITKNEIYQSFNLKELLGQTPTARQKELFYDLAVDKMVNRTVEGKDVDNKKFTRYTKEYAELKGVIRTSVDLVLSGDMLDGFEESRNRNRVKISMASDETGKVHGNITGSYGKPRGNPDKARDFFGFKNERDLGKIINQVKALEETRVEEAPAFDLAELRAAIAAVGIDFEDL
jgi:hypothetical protein